MSDSPRIYGYCRFAWALLMQPVSLNQHLKSHGIDNLNVSGWRLWSKKSGKQSQRRAYITRLAALPLLTLPFSLGIAFGLRTLGFDLQISSVILGWLVGAVIGGSMGFASQATLGALAGLALSVSLSTMFGLTFTLSKGYHGFTRDSSTALFIAIATGATAALIASIFPAITLGKTLGSRSNIIYALAISIGIGALGALTFGPTGGVVQALTFCVVYLRLFLYPLEIIMQFLLVNLQTVSNFNSLTISPIFWHELSCFPLPFLAFHIEKTARSDPDLATKALNRCSSISGQTRVGRYTLTRLRGFELERIGKGNHLTAMLNGTNRWLTSEAEADDISARFWQTARYLQAANTSVLADQQLEHLERAQKTLRDLDRSLLDTPKRSPYPWKQAVTAWQGTIDALQAQAQEAAKDRVPNPFRAGDPLTPDRGGPIFRGRQDIVQQIERQLVDPNRSTSIALLAPRRCGKTSLLQMLPTLLPDAVCIFFDLQGHPVDTPTGFFQALDEQVFLQARQQRGFKLPRLQEGNPFEEAGRWFDALEIAFETVFDGRRLLICLDEFAALENNFPQDEASLHKLMGLFRATIQHRRHVRLLVAGEAPFDELNAMWNDYFISVRQIRFGHLEPSEAFDLVRSPTPEFPDDAIPDDVARHIVERTGSQPFLVQLYAQILVERLNDAQRTQATLDDLEPVEEEALEQGHYYFSNTWQRAPAAAQDMLAALARDKAPPLEHAAVRWLKRRHLIDDDHQLTIPALARFLVDEELA